MQASLNGGGIIETVRSFHRDAKAEQCNHCLVGTRLRDQGIDMPDPDFSQGFGPGAGGRAGIFGDLDPQSPEFQAAAQECQGIFEGGFGPGGGRGGAE